MPYKIGEDVYERYYHLFNEGELITLGKISDFSKLLKLKFKLVENAAKNANCLIKIVETKYDAGNWVIVLQKTGIKCLKEEVLDSDLAYPQHFLGCCGEYGEYSITEGAIGEEEDEKRINDMIRGNSPTKKIKF